MKIIGNTIIADIGKVLVKDGIKSKQVALSRNDALENWSERAMTAEEISAEEHQSKMFAETEIEELKAELAKTDYKAIKYAEGFYTNAEYAPIKEQRQKLRGRINELEKIYEQL